jgi:hypothetical protein
MIALSKIKTGVLNFNEKKKRSDKDEVYFKNNKAKVHNKNHNHKAHNKSM